MQHAGIGNSGIKKKAAELAKYGRNGDTILAHISPAESALLSMNGKTKNPDTGLDEHFAFMPLLIGAAIGALTNKKNPLKGALLGAAMGGIGGAALGSFAPETAAAMGIGDAAGVASAAGGAGAAAGAGATAAGASAASAPILTAAGGLAPLPSAAALAAPAATAGSAGGIGAGLADYFSSPMGIMTGVGTAGQLLTPTYEPEKKEEDDDYTPTDYTPRQSVFEDGEYDTNQSGREGYYYAQGGGIGHYADGGDVPYVEPTDEGTSGKAAFPTAENVNSYGTRGEFNFFPNRKLIVAVPTVPAPSHTPAPETAGATPPFRGWADPRAGDRKSGALTAESLYEKMLQEAIGDQPHFARGGASDGIGGGKDDKIPAMLSDGEHVLTADEVSDLGDGSNKEGQKRVYKMREEIRKHKNNAGVGHRPKAKKPSEYLKAAGV